MKNLSKLVEKFVVHLLSQLLLQSASVTPYLTGELRASALLTEGTTELYGISANDSGNVSLKKLGGLPKSDKLQYDFVLSFYKMNEGFDVALYTHEDLLPVGRKGTARKEGTMPKYLELTVKQNYIKFENACLDVLQKWIEQNIDEILPYGDEMVV